MTQRGFIPNLPIAEYHLHPFLGSTTLGRARRSWAHAMTPFESTKSTIFGGGFHTLIGEPELFSRLYAKAPDVDRRYKEGKDAYAAFLAENKGKTILTNDEWEQMNGMLESILKHKNALKLLTGGAAEVSFFCIDPETGVGVKCRPDYYRSNLDIVDIKTAEDASEPGFAATIAKYGRHIQTALYLDVVSEVTGQKHETFLHLVIEKKPPYAIGIYRLCPDTIEAGRREYKKLLNQYAYCKEIGEFPAYDEEVKAVTMRSWEFGNE